MSNHLFWIKPLPLKIVDEDATSVKPQSNSFLLMTHSTNSFFFNLKDIPQDNKRSRMKAAASFCDIPTN